MYTLYNLPILNDDSELQILFKQLLSLLENKNNNIIPAVNVVPEM